MDREQKSEVESVLILYILYTCLNVHQFKQNSRQQQQPMSFVSSSFITYSISTSLYVHKRYLVSSFIHEKIIDPCCYLSLQCTGTRCYDQLFIHPRGFASHTHTLNCYILIVRLQFVEIKESRTTIKFFCYSSSVPFFLIYTYIYNVYILCVYVSFVWTLITRVAISAYSLTILITILLIVNCFIFMVTLIYRYEHESSTDLKREEKRVR